ncbi:MAG: aldo/keto reductase, partial [Gammaproteobacteria bacterium]
MRLRAIPSTGERIPVMGLGTSDAFETSAGAALAPQREVLERFYALGGRLVDTSPTYGNAEAVVGRLAAELDLTDRLFLATKVHEVGRQAGIAQMEASRRHLGRRRLDLLQVHNLIDVDTQLATLRRWKEQGLVRYIGITHYRVEAFDDLERWMRAVSLDFVQFNYSVATPDAERRLLPLARERGIAVLVNRAFEDGYLFRATRGRALPPWAAEFDCTSWAQFFLKYVLSDEAVTCVIPATSKPRHLVDNMAAGVGRLPDAATRARMRALIRDSV